jgi:hypothetical protein
VGDLPSIITFIQSYPFWFRVFVVACVVMVAFLIAGLIFVPRNSTTGAERLPSAPPPEAPVEAQAVNEQQIIFAESGAHLRCITEVRALRNEENGLPVSRLPHGVFGWIEAWKVNTPVMRLMSTPPVDVLSARLMAEDAFNNAIEIHKGQNASVYVVLFLTEETRRRLEDLARTQPIEATATFRQYREYVHIAAVPIGRMMYWDARAFADGQPTADCRIS